VTDSVYRVTFAASAKRELIALSANAIERIQPKIRELANDPRPPGCKKLRGARNLWRIRIGDYRVVYTVNDTAKTVDVTRIAHRREVYD
jgi:mRNA interferase RelE/StbE